MKIIAIASPTSALNPETLKPHMADEVPATLKLYLGGQVEQFWFREKRGPVFLMSVDSLEAARQALATLPLVAHDLMTYELMPVGPLLPLGRLIESK